MGLSTVLVAGVLGVVPFGAAHAAPLNDCVSGDHGNPVLESFSRAPATLDVTRGGRRVSFTLRAADLGGPGPAAGLQSVWVGLGETPTLDEDLVPVAELAPDAAGSWVGSIVIPRWSRPGRVRLGVLLIDKTENTRSVEPEQLAAAGMPSDIRVTSTPDRKAPQLTALRLWPPRLDTRTSPRTLTVTARTRDFESRVKTVTVNGWTGSQSLIDDPDGSIRLTRVPGTLNKFRARTRVPRWMGTGVWKVYSARVEDHVGNATDYGYRRLGRLGLDRDVKVVSGMDTRQPALRRLVVSPPTVDVRAAGHRVRVTVRAVDSQSGVETVAVELWGRDSGSILDLRRVAGTARNGTWRGSYWVSRCTSHRGNLRLLVVLTDGSGRTHSYGRKSLENRGWSGQVSVKAEDHRAPTAFTSWYPVARTGPVRVMFNESVNGITASSAAVRHVLGDPRLDPTPDGLGPALSGRWACTDREAKPTDCRAGQVRSARFWPADPLGASSDYAVILNPEFSLEVTDLAGNPVVADDLSVHTAPR